ncbi:exported hypothetical protein [Candidatus Sulfopaludibacter sp. SbA3]|nr:exported hypothetical protein [Candidatus Sulfopaludibacter sp. SbA3]
MARRLLLRVRAVLRTVAHFAVVFFLVAALVSSALACAPVKSTCCDPAGHCKRMSKTCDNQTVAILTPVPPPVAMPVATLAPVPTPQTDSSSPVVPMAQDWPPDLCLLHSVFRI